MAGPAVEKKSVLQQSHITSQHTILRRNLFGPELLWKPKTKGESQVRVPGDSNTEKRMQDEAVGNS